MIIAIPSKGEDINSPINEAFSRSKYFIIYYSEDNTYEVIENPEEEIAGPGATERIINKGVDLVIAKDIGGYTWRAFRGKGIKAITGARGTVWEVIKKYRGEE